jgi:hypothetical protein
MYTPIGYKFIFSPLCSSQTWFQQPSTLLGGPCPSPRSCSSHFSHLARMRWMNTENVSCGYVLTSFDNRITVPSQKAASSPCKCLRESPIQMHLCFVLISIYCTGFNLEPDFRFGLGNVPNLEPDHRFRFSAVRFRFRRGRTENQTFFCHFLLSTVKRTSLFFFFFFKTNVPLLYQFQSASKYLTQAVIFCVVFPGHRSTQGPRGTS